MTKYEKKMPEMEGGINQQVVISFILMMTNFPFPLVSDCTATCGLLVLVLLVVDFPLIRRSFYSEPFIRISTASSPPHQWATAII